MKEFYKISGMNNTAIRPKVPRPVLDNLSCKEHLREISGTHAHPWISLGILQEDIVAGLELLYEVILQQKGIRLRIYHGILCIRNL